MASYSGSQTGGPLRVASLFLFLSTWIDALTQKKKYFWVTQFKNFLNILKASQYIKSWRAPGLLWYPVLVPQMTGGELPPLPVAENESVKHWVAKLWKTVPPGLPLRVPSCDEVKVLGPEITNVLKSRRS